MAVVRFLIVDACVLIDFAKADSAILTLVARHVGEVHVATPVFEEVKDIDATMATSLGIKIYEPSLEIAAAAAMKRGRLSFQDRLCLAIATAEGWTCVSNDKQLRAACDAAKVPVLWGFQVLAMLVDARAERGRRPHDRDEHRRVEQADRPRGAHTVPGQARNQGVVELVSNALFSSALQVVRIPAP